MRLTVSDSGAVIVCALDQLVGIKQSHEALVRTMDFSAAGSRVQRIAVRAARSGGRDSEGATGEYVLSGSADDTLVVWDPETGESLLTLHQGNEYDVTAAAISPDGNRIVTGDGENELKVWNGNTGVEIRTLGGHTETVTCVVYSEDGSRIISGSWDDRLIVWDARTGDRVRELKRHTDDISALALSSDGGLIASGSDDRTVRIWESGSGRHLHTIRLRDQVTCVLFDGDSKSVIVGGKGALTICRLPD